MAQLAKTPVDQDLLVVGLLAGDGRTYCASELTQPIPAQVLQLLAQAWQRPGGVSEVEAGFAAAQPSADRYLHEKQRDNPDSAFRVVEIEDLVASGLFEGLSSSTDGAFTVNVHAEHAVADFCSEVYEAWDRLQGRLEAARAVAARTSDPERPHVAGCQSTR